MVLPLVVIVLIAVNPSLVRSSRLSIGPTILSTLFVATVRLLWAPATSTSRMESPTARDAIKSSSALDVLTVMNPSLVVASLLSTGSGIKSISFVLNVLDPSQVVPSLRRRVDLTARTVSTMHSAHDVQDVINPSRVNASMPWDSSGILNTLFVTTARSHSEVDHSTSTLASPTVRHTITNKQEVCVLDVEKL